MENFELDPRLSADSAPAAMLDLCEVRLLKDSNYPWLLLVPQRSGVRELYQLSPLDQQQLIREISLVSERLSALTQADKINVATLGNVVPQLHVHVVARYQADAAWPGPIWGAAPKASYSKAALDAMITRVREAIQ